MGGVSSIMPMVSTINIVHKLLLMLWCRFALGILSRHFGPTGLDCLGYVGWGFRLIWVLDGLRVGV